MVVLFVDWLPVLFAVYPGKVFNQGVFWYASGFFEAGVVDDGAEAG